MAVPRPLQSAITPQAYGFGAVLGAATLLSWALGFGGLAVLLFGLTAFNFAFFRNPQRTAPEGEHRVLAPGDGKVVEVVRLESPDPFVGQAWRVAIFLSVFDVHVNRVPFAGKVRAVTRKGSRFLAAFNGDASELNVQSRIDIEGPNGVRVGVVQITGLIARRIICYAAQGDTLDRGDPYGLICYGSRMELIVPDTAKIQVNLGDRVRSGESVIAELAQ